MQNTGAFTGSSVKKMDTRSDQENIQQTTPDLSNTTEGKGSEDLRW